MTTNVAISILAVLVCVSLGVNLMVALGVGRLRQDFAFWQHALFRIEWFTDPLKEGRPLPHREKEPDGTG